MKLFQSKTILISLFIFLIFSACRSPETNANQTANSNNSRKTTTENVKDSTEEFEKIAQLPVKPEEVLWRELEDKKIIAVLRFSAIDAQTIVSETEKQSPPQNATISSENWFPPELVAKSQQSGDETLKGKTYSANNFLLAPYSKAKITRIDETNYFILELAVN